MPDKKQKVFRSPRLDKRGHDLVVQKTRRAFFCLQWLTTFVHVPGALTYWIELSTEQWSDGSGCEVWVKSEFGMWYWGTTPRIIRRDLTGEVWDMLDKMPIALNRPVRIFFRLVYEEG